MPRPTDRQSKLIALPLFALFAACSASGQIALLPPPAPQLQSGITLGGDSERPAAGQTAPEEDADAETNTATLEPEADLAVEPLVFEVVDERIDVYDSKTLFEKGGQAYDAADWLVSFGYYDKLLKKFPLSRYVPSTMYNSGLVTEQLGRFDVAVLYYDRLIADYGSDSLVADALYRSGECYDTLGLHIRAAARFKQLSEVDKLPEDLRAEAMARYGLGLYGAVKAAPPISEAEFEQTRRILKQASEMYEQYKMKHLLVDNFYFAKARFAVGELHKERSETLPLDAVDDADLEKQLDAIARELLQAQGHYLKTIYADDPEWAQAAVYRIGEMYEAFYEQVNNLPYPETVTTVDEREVFSDELREATKPVRDKAMYAYRRILAFSDRIRLATRWIDLARERLETLTAEALEEAARGKYVPGQGRVAEATDEAGGVPARAQSPDEAPGPAPAVDDATTPNDPDPSAGDPPAVPR